MLVRVTDHVDTAVRRAVRWRLIGGVAAALLLAGSALTLVTGLPAAALERQQARDALMGLSRGGDDTPPVVQRRAALALSRLECP